MSLSATSVPVLLIALMTLPLLGCGGSSRNDLPMRVLTPNQTYSQVKMLSCLKAHGLNATSYPPSDVNPDLSNLPGLVAEIDVLGGGKAYGIDDYPATDEVLLLFEGTPALAREHAATAISDWNKRPLIYLEFGSLPPPPPKPSPAVAASLRSIHGNVYVFWLYPRHYPVRSDGVLASCFAASRA